MTQTHNIKIVRLNSGEDVIADIVTSANSSFTTLNNPMNLMFKRTQKGTVMMMVPWLPIEIINDNIATINNSEILTTADPKQDLIEYYGHMVDYTKIASITNDEVLKNLKAEILDMRTQQDLEMDPETELQVEEVMNNVNSIRKRNLH